MKLRSVLKGARRRWAPRRNCRARLALCGLVLLATVLARLATAQSPAALSAAENSAGKQPAAPAKQAAAPAANDVAMNDDMAAVLNRSGDLNLHGLSLNDALFTIGEQWNVNIVAGELNGKVNGVFRQAPLREILDSILLSNKYNYRAVGKSLVISSVDEFGSSNPSLESVTIPVLTADIDEVVEGARLLTTPQGKVQALKSARSIVVLDFPDRVQMVREFVKTVDGVTGGRFTGGGQAGVPLEVGYFHTQYISAKAAETALTAVLSKSGRIGVLDKEDRLLVSDYAENLAMVEKVLQHLDRPRPQVRIMALIYDIGLQDIEQLGINWNMTGKAHLDANGDPQSSLGIDSIMKVPFQASQAGSTLTFMNLSRNIDITAAALALARANDARLVGNPNVVVMENEEAIFQSVQEIPYQQLTQTQQGGQIGTTSFKEAGITLRVKPKISSEGTIEMQVMPEFSRLTGFTPGDNQPIIDKRTATTFLRICDRQTVVIGGLRQRSDVGDFKGVPYLKDIPGVGRAFRSRETDVRESELVVFIMPEIVSYGDKPSPRHQMVADTVNCRLDQIPVAEGCPPACRRLPWDATIVSPTGEGPGEMLPPGPAVVPQPIFPTPVDPQPAVPQQRVSQQGAPQRLVPPSGGSPQLTKSAPPTSGLQLRRLPVVTTSQPAAIEVPSPRNDLFNAPPSAAHEARRPAAGAPIVR